MSEKIKILFECLGNENVEQDFYNQMYDIGWELIQTIDLIGYYKKPHLKKMIFKKIR